MKKLKENKGSITLEATIVFPFFLAFMLVLINFIKVTTVYVSMDHAVSETTKQIATQVYPLKYLAGENSLDFIKSLPLNMPGNQGSSKQGGTDLISIINKVGKNPGGLTTKALNEVVKIFAAKKIKEYYPLGNIDENDFEITDVKMYYPVDSLNTSVKINNVTLGAEDIAIVVKYKIKLTVPFFSPGAIKLSNTSVERAWVDH